MTDPARDAGRAALSALETALAHKPVRDGAAFSAATERLCAMRDHLPAAERGAVNALISAVLAGHFPLGKTPWPLIEQSVVALRELLGA